MGCFLNADDLGLLAETGGDITDKNLYNYCDNNPIMRADSGGECWHIIVAAGVSAALTAATQLATTGKIDWADIGIAAASGAASAAFGPLGGAIASGIISGGGEIVKAKINNEKIDKTKVRDKAFLGAALSLAGNGTTKALTSPEKIVNGSKAVGKALKPFRPVKIVKSVKSWAVTKWRNKRSFSGYMKEFGRRNGCKTPGYANWKIRNGLSSFYGGKYYLYGKSYKKHRR